MTAIRKRLTEFSAIVVLIALAAVVSLYILSHERLRFPWQGSPFKLNFAFQTAQAVTPGQGQTVRVSGVRIGDISGVNLKNGLAIVTVAIDPKYKHLVHTDATALLRPKTGLKDMFIELSPGSHSAPLAKENSTIPVSATLPDINSDEIFSSLDSDTRQYLELLVNGAGSGLKGRGNDLQEVFARFEPTLRDLARINTAVATRRHNLTRVIHSLDVLTRELGTKGPDVTKLVDSSSAVFRAFASEDKNISRAVGLFPGALRQTTDTLTKVGSFARVLRPAATDLRPAARALNAVNPSLTKLAQVGTPIVRSEIRPFVTAARPLVRNLRPAAANLDKAAPELNRSFVVLNSLFNMLGYNPAAGKGPETVTTDPRSYLFWIAWADHDAANLFSTTDANGIFRPVTLGGTCNTFRAIANQLPGGVAEALLNLTPLLTTPGLCG